jgi:hypothetical protein
MSQTIKPVKWLQTALWMLGVWEIFENTTSEVVNDEEAELWTCSLVLDIPLDTIMRCAKTSCRLDDSRRLR